MKCRTGSAFLLLILHKLSVNYLPRYRQLFSNYSSHLQSSKERLHTNRTNDQGAVRELSQLPDMTVKQTKDNRIHLEGHEQDESFFKSQICLRSHVYS